MRKICSSSVCWYGLLFFFCYCGLLGLVQFLFSGVETLDLPLTCFLFFNPSLSVSVFANLEVYFCKLTWLFFFFFFAFTLAAGCHTLVSEREKQALLAESGGPTFRLSDHGVWKLWNTGVTGNRDEKKRTSLSTSFIFFLLVQIVFADFFGVFLGNLFSPFWQITQLYCRSGSPQGPKYQIYLYDLWARD